METRAEYLKRYLEWLKFQKGKALRKDAKQEVTEQITRVKTELKSIEKWEAQQMD